MKKTFLLFASLFTLFYYSASAQIPNASFESWDAGDDPEGWLTSDGGQPAATSVTEVTPGHGSSKACQLEVVDVSGTTYQALLTTSHHETSMPSALHGWYKFTPVGSGKTLISLAAKVGTTPAGGGGLTITTASSVFKEFIVNMNYIGSSADSLIIIFSTVNSPLGTIFIVDDLSWGASGSSSVKEVNGKGLLLEGALQNPSSGVTDIIYDLPAASDVSLKIFDLNGKELKILVNEKQSAGRYKAQFNADELTSGIYFCQLNAGGNIRTTKLMVAK